MPPTETNQPPKITTPTPTPHSIKTAQKSASNTKKPYKIRAPKIPRPQKLHHPKNQHHQKNAPKNNYTNTTRNQNNIKNETIYTTTPEHQKSIQFGTLQKSSYNIKKRHFLCFFWFSERRKPEAKSTKAPHVTLRVNDIFDREFSWLLYCVFGRTEEG